MGTDIQETNSNEVVEQKTFTQEEVDAIINGRFGRMMEKYKDYDDLKAKAAKFDEIEEASKTELQKATERVTALQTELDSLKKANTVRSMREKVAQDTGVPVNLLTADSEEACAEQAKQILEFSKSSGYPQMHDGGEPRGNMKRTARDDFAEWLEQNS